MESLTGFVHNFRALIDGKTQLPEEHSKILLVGFMVSVLVVILPPDNVQLFIGCLGAFMYVAMRPAHPARARKKIADGAPLKPTERGTPTNIRRPRTPASPVKLPVRYLPEVRQESRVPVVQYSFSSEGFESQVNELLSQIEPDAQSELAVERIVQSVKKSVQHVLPEADIIGLCHGRVSRASAFSVAVPEVDVIVTTSAQELMMNLQDGLPRHSTFANFDARKLQKSATRTIADRLVGSVGFKFRRSGFKCDEPKVTLMAPHVEGCLDPIPLDLSVNSKTALYNSTIIEECAAIEPRALSLIVLVKRWAKDRGICHAAKGHLPPYAWTLLVVYFLQVGVEEGPLIPPLQNCTMLARAKKKSKGEKFITDGSQTRRQLVAEGMSLGTLFTKFMKFYRDIDWNEEVASVRTGRRSQRGCLKMPLHVVALGRNKMQSAPSIEDPFEYGRNVGAVMNEMSVVRLDEEIARANDLISRNAPLEELMQPWEPPATPCTDFGDDA